MPPDTGGYQRQLGVLAPHLASAFGGISWIGCVRDQPVGPVSPIPGVRRIWRLSTYRLPRAVRGAGDLAVTVLAVFRLALGRLRGQQTTLLLASPTMSGANILAAAAAALGVRSIARYPTSGDLGSRRGQRVARTRGVRVVVPSPLQIEEAGGQEAVVVPNAVETPVGIGERVRGRRVVYVGRLVVRKRVDVLVRAWIQARPALDGWSLVLVGDGGSERDSIEAEVQQLVEADPTCGIVHCGRVADAREILLGASAFVFPSDREGMPNSLLEALAAGLPTIAEASRVRQWFNPPPLVLDWDGTTEGLVQQLVRITSDEALRDHLGEAGQRFVASHHSPEAAAAAFAAL